MTYITGQHASIRRQLRDELRRRKMSFYRLQEEAGITGKTESRDWFSTGTRNMKLATLERLIAALGMQIVLVPIEEDDRENE